jgi:hypothetical protein
MCMYERRLQILLDEERYRRIASVAKRRGVSVALVIREAIDAFLPGGEKRGDAARRILEAEQMQMPDPEELREELDAVRSRHA